MTAAIKKSFLTGTALVLGAPVLGGLFTVAGLLRAFHIVGESGLREPTALAHSIGVSLVAITIGLVVGAIGLLVLFITAIVFFASKAPVPAPVPVK